jgi:ABC-type uncharacterized transport system permease subunit
LHHYHNMYCCGFCIWSYWSITFMVSCLYSALALSSIGMRWKCIRDVSNCIEGDILNDATVAGAFVSSFTTVLQPFMILYTLIKNKKRYQGYCIGAALHTTIIMSLYAVMINTSSKKIQQWSLSSLEDLFRSSFYLACLLSGIHTSWIFLFWNLITDDYTVCTSSGEATA